MKSGFTLIELSIGLLLSGIIATALYNSFFITNRVINIADNFIITDFRSALVENQFGKDLEGIFVPEEPDLVKIPAEKPDKNSTEEGKSKDATDQKQKAVEQKPIPPLEKIFYSINGPGDMLNVLSFVTNNPVKVYEKAKNVKPKPRIVRVVYRLTPEEDNPQSFSLIRQESSVLDFKAFDPKSAKPIRGYALASGIKSIKFEFTYPIQKEQPKQESKPPAQDDKKAAQKEEKPKPEYKTVKDWDLQAQKDAQKEQPKIPQFITATCEFWDNQYARDYSFIFKYEIPTFAANIMQKKPTKPPAIKPSKTEAEPKAAEAAKPQKTATEKPLSPLEAIKASLSSAGKI